MKYKMPAKCPVCSGELAVTRLTCTRCSTVIEGEFTPCKFCRLPAEQMEFIEAFIKCRGNIKEVEKELGISYPTVRSRLDGVIESLGYSPAKESSQAEADRRQGILEALERGEITAREAARLLRKEELNSGKEQK